MKSKIFNILTLSCVMVFNYAYAQSLEKKLFWGISLELLGEGDFLAKGGYAGYQHPISSMIYIPVRGGYATFSDFKQIFNHITLVYGDVGLGFEPFRSSKLSLEVEAGLTFRERHFVQTLMVEAKGDGSPPINIKHAYINQYDTGWFSTLGINWIKSSKVNFKLLASLQSYRTGTPVAAIKLQTTFKIKK